MNESLILIDERTGLHVSWYFWLRVLDEANRSARYGGPFGLLMLEAVAAPEPHRRALHDALASVPGAVRSTDLAGLVGKTRVGVLLPEQTPDAAELARQRIVDRLAAAAPAGVAWQSDLYCYPDDGAEISNLLTHGQADGADAIQRPA